MIDFDITKITLSEMWQLTLAISAATGVIFYILKDYVKLGLKAITAWDARKRDQIYKDHGKLKMIASLIILLFLFHHIMHLLIVWIGAIMWSLGFWSPHQ